jgi:hypothetical protein
MSGNFFACVRKLRDIRENFFDMFGKICCRPPIYHHLSKKLEKVAVMWTYLAISQTSGEKPPKNGGVRKANLILCFSQIMFINQGA